MIQPKVKLVNKKTKAIIEVKQTLAGDFIGTGLFEEYKENVEKPIKEEKKEFNFKKSE